MGTTEAQLILVDGYNVIRNTPGLKRAEAISLEHGRTALLERLTARYRHTPHRVVVVFDGDGVAESVQPVRAWSRGQVIFTRRDETADEVICRLAANVANPTHAPGADVAEYAMMQTVVVSDDFEVRQGASSRGATPARVGELTNRMGQAPRHLAKQATHRIFVRSQLAADADEEPAHRQHPRKGAAHHAPRRRGRTPEPRW